MNRIVEAMQGSLTESWGEPVDITEFLTDSTGFFNTTGLGAFTQVWDRSDGRYRPVYTNEAELKIIRAMSWLLVEKVPMAQAWVNRLLDYTIGTGFDWTIKCDDKRLEKAVQAYVRECLDTSKWSSELERETMVREVSEGEFSGELIYDNGQCMLVAREADELTEPAAKRELEDWLRIEFDASWTFGVLTKKSVPEKHYGYHFVKNAAGTDWDYVPAERVVFWKRNVRQRAKRGYSDFYKPHLYLLRADRVLTNTAEGAATQAAIAYIVEHSEGTQRQADNIVKKFAPLTGRVDPMTGLSQRKRRMLPGTRLDVPAGQNYKAGLLGSNNSDIYISVMESALRLAGTVHAFPEGMLTGSYENNNLASAIVAEGPFVQGRIAEQTQRKERMREMILKIVKLGANNRRFGVYGYATWEAIQDLLTIEVIPPKIIPLDPIKHTQALAMQRDKGWVSDKTAMNELGRDIDTETANGLKVAGAEQQAGTGAQPGVQAGNVATKTGQETGSNAGNVATPEVQISSNWQGLSRLQWNRNRRAMADVLADFMAGKTTRQVASVLLKSIGMDDKSIEAILTDAEDGSIDDPIPLTEAERKTLGKPFRTPGGPKKFSVYVKNDKGNVVKVNFGDPKMRIKRQNAGSRRGFRARHNCQDPGPRWKARYWSCRFWSRPSVTKLLKESFSGEYTWDGRTFVRESWLYRQNPRLLEVRDGDGDGKINDGKPSEAPAEKKRKAAQPKSKPKAQKFAVADYSGDRFLKLNKALRTGESLDSSDQTLVRNLDAHLASSPKHKGVTFRVIEDPDGAIAKTIQAGGSFTDKAFASTSTSIPSFVSKGQIAFQVVGKNGVDISSDSLNPGEKEVLFPRNTRFKVVKTKTNEYGALVAILQEIGGQTESLDQDLYGKFERLVEAKDGDGDGLIDDGKPSEAPAEKKDRKRSSANPKVFDWAKNKFGDDEKAENFAKWFGDSKVVDSEGNPLIVYHGTDKEFEEFKPSEKGMLGKGIYSSAKKEDYGTYSAYAKKENAAVMPLYVKLENPHIAIAGKPDTFDAKPENDGTIMIDSRTKAIVWAVAKNPNQVKSAIGNKGTFNTDSNKITESLTGRQKAMLERWKDYP
jgi:hypothetical protein